MIDKYNATFYKKMCLDYINLYEHLLTCINGYDTINEARENLMEQFFMGMSTKFSSSEDIENYIVNLIMGLIKEFKTEKPEFYADVVSKLNKILNKNKFYAKRVNVKTPENGTLSDLDYYNIYLQLKDILNLVMTITRTINY